MLLNWEKIDKSNLKGKLLKEYLSYKSTNPECIIFFQVGSFYETYFQDAKHLSDITGITLTSKSLKEVGNIAMAGFPEQSLNLYIKQMLNKNFKICICQQFYDEEKDEFIRKITRTYTKGTVTENEFLEGAENNFIMAINLITNGCEISYADVSTGQFYKTNGNLDEIILEIEKLEPNEILISKENTEIFKNLIDKYNTTILEHSFFADKKTENILLNYCELTQKSYITKLENIIEYKTNSFLTMDEVTRRNLELTRTRRFLKKKGSLFWFLNYTKTPMGTRLLKKYLDEPLLDIEKIKERQSAVKEILKDEKQIENLEAILIQFCDLSRICAHISNSTIKPKDLYQISKNAKGLKELSLLCEKFKSNLLKINKKPLAKVLNFTKMLEEAIKEDASSDVKSGEIIKEGYCANLDYLKSKLNEYEAQIANYEKKERKKLEIENLKILYSKMLGYYIEIPKSRVSKVPNTYIKKQALNSCSRYTTETLKELEKECNSLKYNIIEFEYELYCKIKQEAKNFIETIRNLAKDIARIDVLNSYSKCAITNNLTKPDFNQDSIFIEGGFHPSLIKLNNELIANDTKLKNGEMIVLTGANMSGKSTYLKHNAIICLLSQIGSFVPAKYANLTIIDKIFIRQGSTDDIINNNSSFMVEMNDLKFILDNITNSSLILLDEPAKSTNAKEGGAIARAFCEYLLNNYFAKTIVATHNLELTKIETLYQNRVRNFVIGNTDVSEAIINDRKIRRGTINSSLAINTATLAKIPQEIINLAKKYATT